MLQDLIFQIKQKFIKNTIIFFKTFFIIFFTSISFQEEKNLDRCYRKIVYRDQFFRRKEYFYRIYNLMDRCDVIRYQDLIGLQPRFKIDDGIATKTR